MARKTITAADGLRAQIFHPEGLGLRGITLMNASGQRGLSLCVAVHNPEGKRKGINSLALQGRDFNKQWERAVEQIAVYYCILPDDPIYKEMIGASADFLRRYNLVLQPVQTVYQQVVTAA